MRRRVMPSPEPRKPAKKIAKRETLHRLGMITAWDFKLSAFSPDGRLFPSRWGEASISALGDFVETVNGVTAFKITFSGIDSDRLDQMTKIGAIMGVKPAFDGFIYLPRHDFSALMTLAAAGKTLHCSASFEKPRYGSGDIFSFSMSTQSLE